MCMVGCTFMLMRNRKVLRFIGVGRFDSLCLSSVDLESHLPLQLCLLYVSLVELVLVYDFVLLLIKESADDDREQKKEVTEESHSVIASEGGSSEEHSNRRCLGDQHRDEGLKRVSDSVKSKIGPVSRPVEAT
ncbi:hypothetical protein RND71_011709 [Anisodus tanguticus]|uniref:Uncharacterized protein n=1 Tax=Anisodus tanguticus TaxID=243964 RepID=A0AAE1SE01_9SOLA|nr:hypothetical protein RND71_011709 [Anisodus tanguticus]